MNPEEEPKAVAFVETNSNFTGPPNPDHPSEPLVRRWLKNQGVLLEMGVAASFKKTVGRSHLNSVSHGGIYRDEDSISGETKLREIDVVVRMTPITNSDVDFTIWLILECKSQTSPPLAFFRGSEPTSPYLKYEEIFLSKANNNFNIQNVLQMNSISILDITNKLFSYGGSSATETNSPDKTPKNFLRDAILQVLSAVDGVSKDFLMNPMKRCAAIFVPIIVVEADMYSISLTVDGKLDVQPTLRELIISRNKSQDEISDAIWVIHRSEIENLALEFANNLQYLNYRTH